MTFSPLKKLIIICLTPLLLSACLPLSSGSGSEASLHTQYAKSADYSRRTKEMHEKINNAVDTTTEAKARLQLAGLYLAYNNPNKSYPKALQQMELFILLDRKTGRTVEIQNWLAILGAVNETRATGPLKKKIKRLNDALKKMEKINAKSEQQKQKLAAENAELKETIEKLKYLDLNLEKKRKDYR